MPLTNNEEHINYRLDKLEDDSRDLKINTNKCSEAILMLGVKLENSVNIVSEKLKEFQDRRNFWSKILIGLVTTGIIALVTQLLRISYVVQSNRIVGGP